MFDTDFIDALYSYGITELPKEALTMTKFTRWGRKGKFWARKNEAGIVFGDYTRDLKVFLPFEKINKFDVNKELRLIANINSNEKDNESRWESVSKLACIEWENSQPVLGKYHSYLASKKIKNSLLRIDSYGNLLVPLRDLKDKIWSLQYIKSDGSKFLKKGGKAKGNFYKFGSIGNRIFLCEGYATAATIYKATNECTIACICAGYLKDAAIEIRNRYMSTEIVFCADNDIYGKINIGVESAIEAAKIVKGRVIYPFFRKEYLLRKPTDFNDLYCLENIECVRHQIFDIWGI